LKTDVAIDFLVAASFRRLGQTTHPILAVGSPAPDFSLPGVDGRVHRLADYAASPVLVVVFTCTSCAQILSFAAYNSAKVQQTRR